MVNESLDVQNAIQTSIQLMMGESKNLRNVQVFIVDENKDDQGKKPNHVFEIAIEYQMQGSAPVRRLERFRVPDIENATEGQVFKAFSEFLIGMGMATYIQEKIRSYIENPMHKI